MIKKKCIALFIVLLLISGVTAGCKNSGDNDLTKVRLSEVAHSVFYAPQYAAIELEYFKDEGIDLELSNALGADKVMIALVSGNADIGFMGGESSVYVYQEGEEDYAVNFAQLTQRAGSFLVGRTENPDFEWSDLIGSTVLGGRAGGMPEMVFEYILKQNGIDPRNDLTIVQNIDYGSTAAAFSSGQGDYTMEFEPFATGLELTGDGYVIGSLGIDSGYVPYTAYSVRKSYLEQNGDLIQRFTNAVQHGLDYVNTHTPEEIAKVIAPQFPETPVSTIALIVERYMAQDTWKEDTVFTEESFNLLQDILDSSGQLTERIPYSDLVTTDYAEKAKNK